MLLTRNYSVLSSYEFQRDFTGWITNEGEYINLAASNESHHDAATEYGFDSGLDAILNGWCRLSQTNYSRNVYCDLHYSRFEAVKRVLERILNKYVATVEFLFYNNRGPTLRDKLMQFVDGHLE